MRMLFNKCSNCKGTNLVMTNRRQLAGATNSEIMTTILKKYAKCKLCECINLSEATFGEESNHANINVIVLINIYLKIFSWNLKITFLFVLINIKIPKMTFLLNVNVSLNDVLTKLKSILWPSLIVFWVRMCECLVKSLKIQINYLEELSRFLYLLWTFYAGFIVFCFGE